MQFVVPKFIEHEAKIVGPLTFKQFIYICVVVVVSFVLYLSIPNIVFVFITAAILLGGASALAFVQIEGRSLPVIIKDFFMFSFAPKLYIWGKTDLPPKFIRKEKKEKKEKEDSSDLRISKSKLNQLSTQLETKTK